MANELEEYLDSNEIQESSSNLRQLNSSCPCSGQSQNPSHLLVSA